MTKEEKIRTAMSLFDKNKPERVLDNLNHKRMGLWAVIHHLYEKNEAITSKEISDSMGVSSARMTVLLQKLEGEHLVEKSPSTKDARSILVSLTEKGQKKAVEIEKYRYECIEQIVEEYSLEELELLFEKLRKIHTIFSKTLLTHEKEENIS